MLKVLSMILRRAPLLVLIVLIWIILSVLSFAGRGKAYKKYTAEDKYAPGVSIFMKGLHDHVLPWSAPENADKKRGNAEGSEDREDKAETDRCADAGALSAKENGKYGSLDKEDVEERSGGKETAGTSKNKDTQDKDAQDKDARNKEVSSTDDGSAGTGDQDPEGKNTDNGKTSGSTGKDPASSVTDGQKGKTDKDSGQKASGSGGQELKVPAQSSTPVVKAKDYGIAQKAYLSPEDTVYNTDKEGLFAPDGTYYSFQEVEDSYFHDALFVGDSRTVGLFEYGKMADAASFLARESTTVYDLFDENEKMDYTARGKKTTERTFRGLLSKTRFNKIYLSVGVNELGVPDTKDFYDEYRRVIRKINKLQPDAIIYIQGIMHVSKDKSMSDPVYNNTAIVQRNQAIATLANGRNIFYIDMNADLCDEDGNLKKELTGDGIHLKASACELWHRFLRKNAIVLPGKEKDAKSSEKPSAPAEQKTLQ